MSLFDSVKNWFNAGQPVEQKAMNTYDSSSTSRKQLSTYNPVTSSPDAAFSANSARTIRARSRQLARNAPLALGALNTTVTCVVGTGLELHSRVDAEYLGMDEEAAHEWQENTERLFRLWAQNEADLERSCTFYGLQEVAFRSALEGGDCFALLVGARRPGALFDTRVQLIEAELVRNPGDGADTKSLIQGIEIDGNRAPLAYHFADTYQGINVGAMPRTTWKRVPAFGARTGRRNVLHLMRKLRPGQTRGIPFLAPVIEPLKQLKDYTEAEITAAVISGMFSIFIKTPAGDGFSPLTDSLTSRDDSTIELAPGLVASLAEGEEPVAFNPGRPNTAFDGFVTAILRQIGVALELPYEVLIKQFVSSYSAARGAIIEAWRFFRARREWLVASFCDPVFEAWMDEAVARGIIDAPGYFDDIQIRRAYLGTEWTGDSMGQLNPSDEINAAEKRVALGVSNRTIETAELYGRDWRSVHSQLAREERKRKEDGFIPGTPTLAGQVPQGANQVTPDDSTDDGEDHTEDV